MNTASVIVVTMALAVSILSNPLTGPKPGKQFYFTLKYKLIYFINLQLVVHCVYFNESICSRYHTAKGIPWSRRKQSLHS
jgi:uncharacterized membrane protein